MSENIENLKSVLKIRILAWYHPNIPVGELFQEMILRNPQALYILRILGMFDNSLKMHFFIWEMVQISAIFIETVQARKSSYWLDITHVFRRHPKL